MENQLIEQFKQDQKKQRFSIKEANEIQKDLILKSHSDPNKWILENAAYFREIIESHPEFVEHYHENPEAFEKFIMEELEKEKIVH